MKELILKEDEYLDEATQEVRCKICHHARRKILGYEDIRREVCMLCPCQAQKYDQDQKARKQQEFMDKIQRHRSVGMREKALRDYTFDNDKGYNQQIEIAKNYVDNWKDMLEKGLGLLFWGNVGTGKTYLAGCIANALLDQGVGVMMTNFGRIVNDLTSTYDRNLKLDDLNRYPLLILDDLGAEKFSNGVRDKVYEIIDSRYRSGLPLIITTNLTLEGMKSALNLEKDRIHDRLLHRCIPVCVKGESIRKMEAAENIKYAGKILKS